MDDNILLGLAITAFAGLSTGIGSALAFFTKKTNKNVLSASMGFSAGVMIYVSFVEILSKAHDSLLEATNEIAASWYTAMGFFGGILLILIIDKLIPSYENPHEPRFVEEMDSADKNKKLYRIGVMAAVAIGIHNFPEGMATFAAFMADPALGIPIAIAIAIHNIPEGIAVSIPIFYATGSRKKAFWFSFASGLAEPVGAIIGYGLMQAFFTDLTFGIMFSAVAGIMVFISLDELLPTAREYDVGHVTIYSLILGMVVMALSLLMLM